jgi:hypothetical protein
MKTVFDHTTREELIARINALDKQSTPQWGQMRPDQMIRHCILLDEMLQGHKKCKRVWLGRIFGRIALRTVLANKPLPKNMPTIPEIKIAKDDFRPADRQQWIARIEAYAQFSNPQVVHAFFGKITQEQAAQIAYKHADHHLQQFNA